MKRIMLTLFILLVGLFHEAKAQSYVYHPFPDTSMIWYGRYTGVVPHGDGTRYYGNWTSRVYGDTIINSLRYWSVGWGVYVREDSLRHVYYMDTYQSQQEKKLYDFSMGIGDTMSNEIDQFTVTRIDTVTYFGERRRVFFVSLLYQGTDVWIEGIGSLIGPVGLKFHRAVPPYIIFSNLCSASSQGNTVYENDTSYVCNLVLGVDEHDLPFSVNAFPNPTKQVLNLSFSLTEADFLTARILDLQGKTVSPDYHFGRLSEGTHTQQINLPPLSSGMYFLECSTAKGKLYERLVVE